MWTDKLKSGNSMSDDILKFEFSVCEILNVSTHASGATGGPLLTDGAEQLIVFIAVRRWTLRQRRRKYEYDGKSGPRQISDI